MKKGSEKWRRILAFFLAASMTVCTGSTAWAGEDTTVLSGETEYILQDTEGPVLESDPSGTAAGGAVPGLDFSEGTPEGAAPELDFSEGTPEGAAPGPGFSEGTPEGTSADFGIVSVEEVPDSVLGEDGQAAGISGSEVSGTSVSADTEPGEAVLPDEVSEDTDTADMNAEMEVSAETGAEDTAAEDADAKIEILAGTDEGISASEDADDGITYLEERTFRSGDAADGAASRLFMRSTLEYELCYGDQLIGESRRIYDSLVDEWMGGNTGNITCYFETQLPYSQVNIDQIYHNAQTAFDAFVYDYPEVFWLRDVTVSIGRNSSNLLVSILLKGNERYSGAKNEVGEFKQAVEKETNFVRSLLPGGANQYTIVKTIHDYICGTVDYDYQGINYREMGGNIYYDTAHTAAGVFLKDRIVVCEGYAKAFEILCRQFGMECTLIIGSAGGENHMWNYVKMDDGKWYLVDTTWDDQVSGLRDTYLLAGSMSQGLTNLVWQERQSWTDFSGSGAKSFVLPILNPSAYESEEHRWQEIARVAATCRSYETAQYFCELCGETKTEIVGAEVDHDWGPYVSNNDATWQKDGTKTAVCQYGCGETKTITDVGSRLTSSIKLNVSSLCLRVGQSTSAVKVTLVKGDEVVSWKTSNSLIVSVNKKGKITAGMKTGEAVITLATLSGMTRKIPVTVQKETVETTGITGLSKTVTLKKGKKLQLAPVIEPVTSMQKVTYSSSNKKVAAVTAKGVITAKKAGTAKITVKSGKKKFKVTVKVKKA